jgi:hypothetical protein
MLNSVDRQITKNDISRLEENSLDFALGFGLGGKWISKKGFIFELSSGIGKNLFVSNSDNYDIVVKFNFSIGYRF